MLVHDQTFYCWIKNLAFFPHSLNNYAKWNPSYISFDPLVSEIDTLSPLQSIETCWRPLFFHDNFRVFNIDSSFFVFINS